MASGNSNASVSPKGKRQKENQGTAGKSNKDGGKTANPANEPAVIHLQSLLKRITDKLGGAEAQGAHGRRCMSLYFLRKIR